MDNYLKGMVEEPKEERRFVIKEVLKIGAEPIILSRAEPVLPWNERVVSFQVNPESATIQDIVRMAEELTDQPTRKEWEEWAFNTAKIIKDFNSYTSELEVALLSMPGVPKE